MADREQLVEKAVRLLKEKPKASQEAKVAFLRSKGFPILELIQA